MDKSKLDNCVEELKGKGMKNWIKNFLTEKVPDYFWEIPASSTGKYHPSYSLGEGGLVRHTKATVNIAIDLLNNELYNFNNQEQDIIIAALILHDTFKHDFPKEDYSVADHGVIVSKKVLEEDLPKKIKKRLAGALASHMGQWNTDYTTGEVIAPKPETELEKFVHLCDYLASRKFLEINFEEI